MGTSERVMMGFSALVAAVLLVNGLQRGAMLGEYREYDADAEPMRFSLSIMAHVATIAVCLWCAAGFDLADAARRAGLKLTTPLRSTRSAASAKAWAVAAHRGSARVAACGSTGDGIGCFGAHAPARLRTAAS